MLKNKSGIIHNAENIELPNPYGTKKLTTKAMHLKSMIEANKMIVTIIC